jgi:hypothetical protein
MSWEAFRWTAKSPSELYHVLGPHGVDDLLRQAVAACWRMLPEENRTFDAARQVARGVFDRNIKVWKSIKKPTPDAFFKDLFPTDADGFVRQAMVLCWMMMPRTGGREVTDALKIVGHIFERNLESWEDDNRTFTKGAKFSTKSKRPRKAAEAGADGKPRKKSKAAKAGTRSAAAKRAKAAK